MHLDSLLRVQAHGMETASKYEIHVLWCLAMHADNTTGIAWPGPERIARYLYIGDISTVRRTLRSMVNKGLIENLGPPPGTARFQAPNRYRVTLQCNDLCSHLPGNQHYPAGSPPKDGYRPLYPGIDSDDQAGESAANEAPGLDGGGPFDGPPVEDAEATAGAYSPPREYDAGAYSPPREYDAGADTPLRGGADTPLRGGADTPPRESDAGADTPLRGGADTPPRQGSGGANTSPRGGRYAPQSRSEISTHLDLSSSVQPELNEARSTRFDDMSRVYLQRGLHRAKPTTPFSGIVKGSLGYLVDRAWSDHAPASMGGAPDDLARRLCGVVDSGRFPSESEQTREQAVAVLSAGAEAVRSATSRAQVAEADGTPVGTTQVVAWAQEAFKAALDSGDGGVPMRPPRGVTDPNLAPVRERSWERPEPAASGSGGYSTAQAAKRRRMEAMQAEAADRAAVEGGR